MFKGLITRSTYVFFFVLASEHIKPIYKPLAFQGRTGCTDHLFAQGRARCAVVMDTWRFEPLSLCSVCTSCCCVAPIWHYRHDALREIFQHAILIPQVRSQIYLLIKVCFQYLGLEDGSKRDPEYSSLNFNFSMFSSSIWFILLIMFVLCVIFTCKGTHFQRVRCHADAFAITQPE